VLQKLAVSGIEPAKTGGGLQCGVLGSQLSPNDLEASTILQNHRIAPNPRVFWGAFDPSVV